MTLLQLETQRQLPCPPLNRSFRRRYPWHQNNHQSHISPSLFGNNPRPYFGKPGIYSNIWGTVLSWVTTRYVQLWFKYLHVFPISNLSTTFAFCQRKTNLFWREVIFWLWPALNSVEQCTGKCEHCTCTFHCSLGAKQCKICTTHYKL